MVRTRGDNTGRRVVAAKAPRKQLGGGGGSSSSNVLGSPGAKDKTSGGNPVRWTQTPSWQKGIGTFFLKPAEDEQNSSANGNSPASNGNPVSSAEDSTSALTSSNVEECSSGTNINSSED